MVPRSTPPTTAPIAFREGIDVLTAAGTANHMAVKEPVGDPHSGVLRVQYGGYLASRHN
jgi:hypothetical protein